MPKIGKHYDLDTDGTLANNSDSTIASQKAVKTYVDNNKTVVDSALSDTSENPVQNKVIKITPTYYFEIICDKILFFLLFREIFFCNIYFISSNK